MKTKDYWINQLSLEAHPEGGFFKETYRSDCFVDIEGFEGRRNLSTGIYFLLDKHNFSAFHRIKSDEMWHFYQGDPLAIHMISDKGVYSKQIMGNSIDQGHEMQFVVPANCWFASEVYGEGDFSLVGCTVAPGFDFTDFELADKNLATQFPEHRTIINRLTH